ECKTANGLSVAFIGALDNGRTVRSLTYLLSKFDRIKFYFIAPREMQVKPDILAYLDKYKVSYELASDPSKIISQVDVVYQTRIDRERLQR
ncbi:MAG TPA: aspartate carbamoyltransferase, partial [Bacteroidetes bacterium]|nr:aspartate carbamoyltransferase [Bacteroidota bacterium]